MPIPAAIDGDGTADGPAPLGVSTTKKRKILKYEKVYLDNLPSADRYYSMCLL